MLSKQDIELLLEKAVAWDKSILGRTTGGIGSLFSFLKGKISNGLDKAKIRSLVTNWGIEYLNALKSVDKNLPAPNTSDPLAEDTSDDKNVSGELNTDTSNNSEEGKSSTDIFEDFSKELPNGPVAIQSLITALQPIDKWVTINNAPGYQTLVTTVTEPSKWITDEEKSQICEDFLIDSKDRELYNKCIGQLKPIFLAITVKDSTPYKLDQALKTNNNLKEFKESVRLAIKNLESVSTLYKNAQDFANNYSKVLLFIKDYESEPKNGLEKDKIVLDASTINYFKNKNLNDEGFNTEYADNIKRYLKIASKINESFYLLLEAVGVKVPDYIKSITDGIDINEIKKIKNIRDSSLSKMNFKLLDILKYQANEIIEKAKQSKNEKEHALAIELQQEWDLGLKYLNMIFQDVIDTDQVMSNVRPNDVTAEVKAKLKDADQKVSVLQNLNVSDALSASGGQFRDTDMYLFNVNFKTPRGTKAENIYLGLSPLAKMVEEKDGVTYYWHRLFGAYDYDQAQSKIVRSNPFKDVTQNATLINNFDDDSNMYYIVFKRQAASKFYDYAYVYSNKGSLIWKNKVYTKIDNQARDVIEQTKKNTADMMKYGNVFQIKINARYLVDPTKIESYPGIDLKAIKDEQGAKRALFIHDELVKILHGTTEEK